MVNEDSSGLKYYAAEIFIFKRKAGKSEKKRRCHLYPRDNVNLIQILKNDLSPPIFNGSAAHQEKIEQNKKNQVTRQFID